MFLKKILAVALLFIAINANAQSLKLVLSKGQKYEVTTTTKANSVASVMGQDMETTSSIMNVEVFEVKNTKKTQTDLTATITRLVINSSAMGQETNFDSDKKDNTGSGLSELNDVVNQPRNITIDENGKSLKDDRDSISTDVNKMMGAGGGGNLRKFFFREKLIGKDIKVGTSWMDSTSTKDEKITTNTVGTYTVKSVENNVATITFTGITKLTGTMEQMGLEMEMSSTSNVSAETKLDMMTGVVLEASTTTDGTMSIEAMGVSIPTTVKTTESSKVKLLN